MRTICFGVLLGTLALGSYACGDSGCEWLAESAPEAVQVTNDRDTALEVTVRGRQVIYALGTNLNAGDCARWPVAAEEFYVELSGACQGESEPFEVQAGQTYKVSLSAVPCQ